MELFPEPTGRNAPGQHMKGLSQIEVCNPDPASSEEMLFHSKKHGQETTIGCQVLQGVPQLQA